jgi:hypothetical protein
VNRWEDAEVPRVAAALTVSLVAVVALAVQTGFLALVVATIVVAQGLIAGAPAPADARGRAIATPQVVPTMVAGLVSAMFAYEPWLLLGARGTRAGADGAVSTGVFAGVLVGLAAGVIAAILAQILRKDGRPNLVLSVATVTSLALFAATSSAWIGAARASGSTTSGMSTGSEVVTLSCAAVAAGVLAWVLPWHRGVAGASALLVGGGAAAGTAWLLGSPLHLMYAATVGVGAAGFAVMGLAVGAAWTRGRGHVSAGWGFPGALAFVLTAPVVYIGAQLASASL